MNSGLAPEVWKTAQHVMSAQHFGEIVAGAITSYKRLPGHSDLERLHASDIGALGIDALRVGLRRRGWLYSDDSIAFVSLRAPLRAHLYAVLQRHLICNSHASGAVIDGQFARDLGL